MHDRGEANTRKDRAYGVWMRICAVILVFAALYYAGTVFAPLAFALLAIAILWPVQKRLQKLMPQLLALTVVIVVTIAIVMELSSLITWSFGRVGRYVASNAANFQVIYGHAAEWLQAHGVPVVGIWAEHFNVVWLARMFREITVWMSSVLTFSAVMLTYIILGLLEIDSISAKLRALENRDLGEMLLAGGSRTGERMRMYMLVRSLVSLVTGLLVWGFAAAVGLDLALEWGVIAFVLNFIPIIGTFIATIAPTIIAFAQFGSWEMGLVIFACLNLIQFLVGSYLEPRIAGRALSISPFMVLFAVFFWTFLWGIAGAFIGVPILIAIVTLCEQHPSSRWIAELLASPGDRPA